MGGHGGLNILPQKKWNVYNMENRNIVERDKRKERERVQKEKRKEHKEQAQNRIQKLKQKRRDASHTPSRSGSQSKSRSRSKSQSQSQKKQVESKINAELREILESQQHINLFKEEEKYLIQKENTQAKIELEKEFFKDKPFDLSTKFLGQYDQVKPWYIQQRQNQQETQLQQNLRQQLQQFKEKKDNYYQILDISKKYQEQTLISQIEAKKEETVNQEKKEETIKNKVEIKAEKKKQKKLQKLGEQLRELLGSDDSELEEKRKKQKQYEREKLRKERLQREKVERSREQKLLSSVYEFKKQ